MKAMSDEENAEQGAHGLRDVIPFLRDADHLFDQLEGQAALVHEAASLFAHPTNDDADKLARIEQDVARLSNAIEQYLQHAYALKIDREVLYEASSHLSGVFTHVLRGARTPPIARSGASSTPGATEAVAMEWRTKLVDMIVRSIAGIAKAVGGLRTNDHVLIARVARELRDLARDTNRAYDDALAALIDVNGGNVDDGPTLTREAFALEELKHIIRRCAAAGEYLAYVAVKLS
jgi:hypothetical protein